MAVSCSHTFTNLVKLGMLAFDLALFIVQYADSYPALLGLKLGNGYLENVINRFCGQTIP